MLLAESLRLPTCFIRFLCRPFASPKSLRLRVMSPLYLASTFFQVWCSRAMMFAPIAAFAPLHVEHLARNQACILNRSSAPVLAARQCTINDNASTSSR